MRSRERFAVLACVLGLAVCLGMLGCGPKEEAEPEAAPEAAEPAVPAKPGAPEIAVVRRCAAAPTIDGDLADACWKRAKIGGVWIDPNAGGAADPHPDLYVCYDDKNIYVGVHNPEPQMQNIIADVTSRDGAVWNDDSIEVFLDPSAGKETYHQFIVNTAGVLYDAEGHESSWDSKAQVKVKKMTDGWSVEFSIPLSDLGVTGSPKGQTWTGNFCRNRLGAGEPHRWSDTGPDEHNWAAFGKLKME